MKKQLNSPDAAAVMSCLMIPTQGKNLILPNVTVAEVIPYIDPIPKTDSPKWFLGHTGWRGTQIPVVSFETVNSQIHSTNSSDVRIAVLNGTTNNIRIPFFGLIIQGIPRMIKVGPQDMQPDNSALSPAEKMSVNTSMGRAVVPNLDLLEEMISKVI